MGIKIKILYKVCNNCKESKPLSDYYKLKNGSDRYRGTCKKCAINKKGRKERQLKSRYGISTEDYNKLFQEQGGCCAICKTHQSNLNIALAVDHCHSSKVIRGLLCYNCNMGLGRFKDSAELLLNAIQYLKSV